MEGERERGRRKGGSKRPVKFYKPTGDSLTPGLKGSNPNQESISFPSFLHSLFSLFPLSLYLSVFLHSLNWVPYFNLQIVKASYKESKCYQAQSPLFLFTT